MATTWKIDTSHSGVHFTVRHMVFAKVRGTFTKFSGALVLEEPFEKSTVSVDIEAASIETRDEKRDGHLRSADFFDVEKFPKLTFRSKKVEGTADAFKVTGELTMHGATREVVLHGERTGTGKDPWGNERAGFSAKAQVDRKDFGLTWNQALETGGVLVGDRIDIELEVEAIKG